MADQEETVPEGNWKTEDRIDYPKLLFRQFDRVLYAASAVSVRKRETINSYYYAVRGLKMVAYTHLKNKEVIVGKETEIKTLIRKGKRQDAIDKTQELAEAIIDCIPALLLKRSKEQEF